MNNDLKMALLIVLIGSACWNRKPPPALPAPHGSFTEQLRSLVNQQITVFTSGSESFSGVLTSANPNFITLFQSSCPKRVIYVPTAMISAITLAVTNHSAQE